jgi:hypothetical protein
LLLAAVGVLVLARVLPIEWRKRTGVHRGVARRDEGAHTLARVLGRVVPVAGNRVSVAGERAAEGPVLALPLCVVLGSRNECLSPDAGDEAGEELEGATVVSAIGGESVGVDDGIDVEAPGDLATLGIADATGPFALDD